MNHTVVGLAVALACAPAVVTRTADSTPPVRSPQGAEWNWHGRVAAGKTLEIRGVNGNVTAEPSTGEAVVVTATKRAHGRGDPDDVKIQVVEHDGNVTICAVYPGASNRCAPGDDYSMNTRRNDVEVEFRAQVPAGVAFAGGTTNGDVDVNVTGPIDVETTNGDVRIETASGGASAETTNGGVTAIVRGQGTTPLRFSTTNGGVTVSVPKDLNADVEAETTNGSIETDFPISVTGRISRQHLSGRIGQGGRRLHLETTNGSIRLRAL